MPATAHAEDLSSGRQVGPGDELTADDLVLEGDDAAAIAHDQRLVDDVLIETTAQGEADKPLAGQALEDRISELGIEGTSSLTADEKREAVADREAELRAETNPDDGVTAPGGDE